MHIYIQYNVIKLKHIHIYYFYTIIETHKWLQISH